MSEKSMTRLEEIERLLQASAERHAQWEIRWEKEQAERAAEQAKRDAKADRDIAQMRKDIGGMGKSMGEHAEQFFVRAMQHARKHSQPVCGIAFDKVAVNRSFSFGDIDEEYDIFLHNGDATVIIEVKYKFQMHDLKTFVHRKANNFRILCPKFADETIYLAVAGFSFAPGVIAEAKRLGVIVMQKDGKHVDIDGEHMKTF